MPLCSNQKHKGIFYRVFLVLILKRKDNKNPCIFRFGKGEIQG